MKKTIRLTESDLHRVVAETVRRVINEVQVNGQSLHGNNAEDWGTMQNIRRQQFYDSNGQNQKAKNAWMRNFDNKKDMQDNGRQQQSMNSAYVSPLVSRKMNNGKYMIFDPNKNQPVVNMEFDNASPYMIQGHNSITAVKGNATYEVYPNGNVERTR